MKSNIFLSILAILVIYLVVLFTDLLGDEGTKLQIKNLFYLVSVLVGVVLGPYYFVGRINFETKRDIREHARKRCQRILEYYDNHNTEVMRILCFTINSDEDLNQVRGNLERSFSTIQHYLEVDEKSLKFTEIELKEVLRVLTFIDKNQLIMHTNFQDLKQKKAAFSSLIEVYNEFYNAAHKIVLNKVIELEK